MNIVSIKEVTSIIVETDASIYGTYRRLSAGNWEQLMGESWEPCYTQEKELEEMYQKFINSDG